MRHVGDITLGNPRPSTRKPLTELEKQAVAYFFMRVKAIYGQQYFNLMPDETTEAIVKREFARQVCAITKDKMDSGFEALHHQRQSNPKDWEFLNLDKVCGLVKTGGQHWSQRVLAAKDREASERKALPQKRDPEVIRKGAELLREARKGLI